MAGGAMVACEANFTLCLSRERSRSISARRISPVAASIIGRGVSGVVDAEALAGRMGLAHRALQALCLNCIEEPIEPLFARTVALAPRR